jgi:hypothetical protein
MFGCGAAPESTEQLDAETALGSTEQELTIARGPGGGGPLSNDGGDDCPVDKKTSCKWTCTPPSDDNPNDIYHCKATCTDYCPIAFH